MDWAFSGKGMIALVTYQDTNMPGAFRQQACNMGADETGRAGHQRCHEFESCHLSSFQLSPNFRFAPKTADGS